VWLPSVQVLLARGRTGSAEGLTLAIKGGHNNEHHNHNDVGSFIVALGGVPVIVDAGRPTYTAQTFSPQRYDIWSMQSAWHNTPLVRGTQQAHGRQFAARDVTVEIDDRGCLLELQLADAYPRSDLTSWRRSARLDRGTGHVTVTDSWMFQEPSDTIVDRGPARTGGQRADAQHVEVGPTWWSPPGDGSAEGTGVHGSDGPTLMCLLVAGEVVVGPGRAQIIALDGAGTVLLTWSPADAPAAVTVRELDDPMLRSVWGNRLTRLGIDVSAYGLVGALELTIRDSTNTRRRGGRS
jgi:hypothetical protein